MDFSKISDPELRDAAFFRSLAPAEVMKEFVPLPVMVDGVATIAFCVRATPVGFPDRTILHPVMLIPHRALIIQDLREGRSKYPLSRVEVIPRTARQGKFYVAATEDPNAFFGTDWGK